MHAVRTMCRLLEVSPSGYYAWGRRVPSAVADAALGGRIRAIHEHSRGTYGAPRVRAELAAEGQAASRKRVARLMQDAGLAGVSRRRRFATTTRARQARPAPDLVDRNFAASGRDQLWVADITYIPTWAGFLYLAVVLDAWSRRVVGWAMATQLRTELVLEALNMALTQRRPTGVIHHSDQGTQYTSIAFGARCRQAGVRPSMGSVGDCFDNAMCESFSTCRRLRNGFRTCHRRSREVRRGGRAGRIDEPHRRPSRGPRRAAAVARPAGPSSGRATICLVCNDLPEAECSERERGNQS
jgi:putative transposase